MHRDSPSRQDRRSIDTARQPADGRRRDGVGIEPALVAYPLRGYSSARALIELLGPSARQRVTDRALSRVYDSGCDRVGDGDSASTSIGSDAEPSVNCANAFCTDLDPSLDASRLLTRPIRSSSSTTALRLSFSGGTLPAFSNPSTSSMVLAAASLTRSSVADRASPDTTTSASPDSIRFPSLSRMRSDTTRSATFRKTSEGLADGANPAFRMWSMTSDGPCSAISWATIRCFAWYRRMSRPSAAAWRSSGGSSASSEAMGRGVEGVGSGSRGRDESRTPESLGLGSASDGRRLIRWPACDLPRLVGLRVRVFGGLRIVRWAFMPRCYRGSTRRTHRLKFDRQYRTLA